MSFCCRSCAGTRFAPVIDLGETPLANALLTPETMHAHERKFPLNVVFCEACCLVQITETVPPEQLFSDYVYFSSVSDAAVASAAAIAGRLVGERRLNENSLVVEAASNDGYLLRHYIAKGVPVLGVEPAANIAEVANKNGVRTVCQFFGLEEARRLVASGKRCDVFHANNVLAHVPDLNGFVAGIAEILKPSGIGVIEAPYLRDLIEKVEFDTIYHEHLCYFSLTALDTLFKRHGLTVCDVEKIPIHGGSLRIFAAHADTPVSASVKQMLADEDRIGMKNRSYYADFASRVDNLKRELLSLLKQLKSEGRHIAAYGASAKGSTLLNFFRLSGETIDFVADRSPAKQGKVTPGSHLAIVHPDHLLQKRPDYCLLLTWNFATEILQQQEAYRKAGGKFILPVPQVSIV